MYKSIVIFLFKATVDVLMNKAGYISYIYIYKYLTHSQVLLVVAVLLNKIT